MSDVEAMFYQVRVPPEDRKALKFLWWPDGDLDQPVQEYEMNVHLFGGASSPSCANFALRRTAQDNKAEFDPETTENVERNFYVDDCLKSIPTDPEAVRLANQLRGLLARGRFRLTKWTSNSKAVLESLPESERSEEVKDMNLDKSPTKRALGVRWNVSSDKFGFSETNPAGLMPLEAPLGQPNPGRIPGSLAIVVEGTGEARGCANRSVSQAYQ
ncbi:uncharacterized protein LOC114544503 [Dendronephthya gigantea]|uniref:uncharacterized protein LOC114544503 n=1 Tax=Dendronephthya gigantea TaxID=151771 RepID=UPI00106CE33F|nr:uncharacterized protein LOC114544503 [Dendronephthya gigantea]